MELIVNFPLVELDKAVCTGRLKSYVAGQLYSMDGLSSTYAYDFNKLVSDVTQTIEKVLTIPREDRPSGMGCVQVCITPPQPAKNSSATFANEPARV